MNENIDTIILLHKIATLLGAYKIEKLAETTFTKYKIQRFSAEGLNSEILSNKFKLVYDAAIGVQAELGLMLIAIESYQNSKKNEDNKVISSGLFHHHYSMTIESIYRVWERFSHILNYLHTGDPKKEKYYDGIVHEICECNKYSDSVKFELKKHYKHWSKISEIRNSHSHEGHDLICNETVDLYPIINCNGLPFLKDVRLDWREKLDVIKCKYVYLKKLDNSIMTFFQEFKNKASSNSTHRYNSIIWLPCSVVINRHRFHS